MTLTERPVGYFRRRIPRAPIVSDVPTSLKSPLEAGGLTPHLLGPRRGAHEETHQVVGLLAGPIDENRPISPEEQRAVSVSDQRVSTKELRA